MWSHVCRIQVYPACVLSILETQGLKVGESLKSRLCPFLRLNIVIKCNFSNDTLFSAQSITWWVGIVTETSQFSLTILTTDQRLASEHRLHIAHWSTFYRLLWQYLHTQDDMHSTSSLTLFVICQVVYSIRRKQKW